MKIVVLVLEGYNPDDAHLVEPKLAGLWAKKVVLDGTPTVYKVPVLVKEEDESPFHYYRRNVGSLNLTWLMALDAIWVSQHVVVESQLCRLSRGIVPTSNPYATVAKLPFIFGFEDPMAVQIVGSSESLSWS